MKFVLTLSILFAGNFAMAQTATITEAIIHSTTNITTTEDEEQSLSQVQAGGNERMRMFRSFGEGETKTSTFIKGGMVKTDFKSETIKGSIIRDNDQKITTTLMQVMGRKTGFFVTDQEQEDMKKRMDSMMQARAKTDTATTRINRRPNNNQVDVVYSDDTKKIAGYICKKAFLVTTNFLGQKDSTLVWYSPDLKFANLNFTGGTSSLSGMMRGSLSNPGFEKVDGFIMQYESKMGRNRLMEVTVTKIDTTKKIEDKEFDIPKGYDVKPMKEMQSMFGTSSGGMQIRVERRN